MSWLSRVTGLAGPAVVLLAISVGSFVAIVRYTDLVDPAANSGWMTSMDRTHAGSPPCLRYPSPPTPASILEAADALADAGVRTDQVRELIGDLYARAQTRERAIHPRTEPDEYLDSMAASTNVLGRVTLFLKRDRLADQLRSSLTMSPPVKLTIGGLPEAQRGAFEAQWTRDPAVFVLPGLLKLVERLAVIVTSARLDAAQVVLEQQAAKGEAIDLDGLPSDVREDEWGNAFELEGQELKSLGRDRTAGGTGVDADQARVIQGAVAAPVAQPEPPVACEGKTKTVLPRAELDAALADLAVVSTSARVTPAFVDGVATGFRVKSLRAGSLLVHAGLCDGDVVTRVNGLALTSPDKALEIYSSMKDARRVEVAITRDGKPFRLVVELR